jgi:CheY-like chemotaxis protein
MSGSDVDVVRSVDHWNSMDVVRRSRTKSKQIYMHLTSPPSGRYSLRTVLVVDDAILNRKMVCRCLRSEWNKVMEAGDGLEAVAVLKKAMSTGEVVDAVLLDYEMPGLDGPSTANVMRDEGYEGVIIGVTGHALRCYKEHFISRGANYVLTKPVDTALLCKTVSGECVRELLCGRVCMVC